MAQIVQPNPNAIGGTTPTKVGAVIFDKPQYDPLTIQMKVMGDLDEWAKDKQAEAAKQKEDAAKLIADIDFDTKGIYDQDTPYFTEGRQKLLDAQQELYKYQPNTPEFRQAYAQAEREKRKYQTEVEASIMHKQMFADTFKQFDPLKHDANVYKNWQARMRTAPTIEERIKIAGEPALVPKIGNFQEMLGKRVKDGLYKPTETEEDVKLPGRFAFKKTTQYTDQNIKDYAKSIKNGDEDMRQSAENEFNNLKQKHSLLYDEIVKEAEEEGIDPLENFIRKQIKQSFTTQIGLSNVTTDPFYAQAAQYEYGGKDIENAIDFIVEQSGNLLNGNVGTYKIGGKGGGIGYKPPFGAEAEAEAAKPYYSDQFQGSDMGTYTIRVPKTDALGNPIDGQEDIVSKRNLLLRWKWQNGKPYIKTEETLYNKGKVIDGVQIDNDGFKPASQTDVERLIEAKFPISQRSKALDMYRAKLIKEGGYQKRYARPSEMKGQTKEPVTETPKKVLEFKGGATADEQPQQQPQGGTKDAETKSGFKQIDVNSYIENGKKYEIVDYKIYQLLDNGEKKMIKKLDPKGKDWVDLGNGYTYSHVSGIEKTDNSGAKKEPKTQAEWNAEWAKLPKGGKMVGLDGITYTKK